MAKKAKAKTKAQQARREVRNQRPVFDFFVERFESQEPFTKNDVEALTTWTGDTFRTYWSKQFKQFVIPADFKKKTFRVGDAFRPYASWEAFRQHVTQVRRVSSDYSLLLHEAVMVFDFFMPLTNEAHLRNALDALFYKDTIVTRIKALDRTTLQGRFLPNAANEPEDAYFDRLSQWIADHFIGYSIMHVGGRYRIKDLMTMVDAAAFEKKGGRYLMDETTAVVRFIFPCGKPLKRTPPQSTEDFDDPDGAPSDIRGAVQEASNLRWFFKALFVRSILQVVNGEDEIWMIETGMRNRLHIWKVEGGRIDTEDVDADDGSQMMLVEQV